MFAAWGRGLAAHRRLVALLAAISLVAVIVAMVTVAPNLESDGFVSEEAESAQVDEIVAVTPSLDRARRAASFTALADAWRLSG